MDKFDRHIFEKNFKSFDKSDVANYHSNKEDGQINFDWLISADKIFSSDIEGFKEYSKFYQMEISIRRFSLNDGTKMSDSVICGKDVKIYMPPSRSCAMILGNLANGKEISKIIVKKVMFLSKELTVIEEKEFTKCFVQSFERNGEIASFTFRYSSYSDKYQDFKTDGSKLGTAATKLDLTTWEVESK